MVGAGTDVFGSHDGYHRVIYYNRGSKVCINGTGHMTKMDMVKTLRNLLDTHSPMILKLGMLHRGIKFYEVCINYDPKLTLGANIQYVYWLRGGPQPILQQGLFGNLSI